MKKKIIESPHDFKNLIGKELGKSSWKLIDQLTIDQFAKSTGDYQWIHVDLEKAKKESPYKNKTLYGDLSGYSFGLGYDFNNSRLDLSYENIKRSYSQNLYQSGNLDPLRLQNNTSIISLSLTMKL